MNTSVNYHLFLLHVSALIAPSSGRTFVYAHFVLAQACNFVCSYLKFHRRLEIKSTNDHAPTSFLNTSHLMMIFGGFFHSVTLLVRICPSVAYK